MKVNRFQWWRIVLGACALAIAATCQKMPSKPVKPAPPTVQTVTADAVAARSATLNGRVNPNGALTFWFFVYSEGTQTPETTSVAQAGAGKSEVPVSRDLTGLKPGTRYRYRLIATNGVTTVVSDEDSLRTRQIAHIVLDSATISFSVVRGSSLPPPKSFTVVNTGGDTLSWSASSNAAWLSVLPPAGRSNRATLNVKVLNNGLLPGNNSATITVSGTDADNSPQTVQVSCAVVDQPAHIGLDSMMMAFEAIQNGPLPTAKSFVLRNTGGGTLNWSAATTAAWLSVDPASGSSNIDTVTARIISTAVTPGIHSAVIIVSAAGADNSPESLLVSYTVTAPPHIVVDSATMSFASSQYGPLPPSKTFRISNAGDGTLKWSISHSATWLDVVPDSGSGNPSVVTVSVNATNMAPGSYQDNLQITATGADNSPQIVGVTYVVGPQLPHIALDSARLTFVAYRRGARPAPKAFTITNTGKGTLQYTLSGDRDWFLMTDSINPTNDTTIITVEILNTDLPVGVYSGTVTVQSQNADNSPQDVSIAYEVRNPWELIASSLTGPGPRYNHAMVYDSASGSLIVIGGYRDIYHADVWQLDLNQLVWTQLAADGDGPTGRIKHSAVYDQLTGSVILFGGLDGAYRNDVWRFSLSGRTWTKLAESSTGPTGRVDHSAIYDAATNSMVICGGYDGSYRGDVWRFSLTDNTWAKLAGDRAGPEPRQDHSAVCDPGTHSMILFGGSSGSTRWGDVWRFDLQGLTWSPITTVVAGPTGRKAHSAIWDPILGAMWVFGGYDGSYRGDLWLFLEADSRWVQMADDNQGPPGLSDHTAIYDSRNQDMIVFGGGDAIFYYGGVWRFDFCLECPSGASQHSTSNWTGDDDRPRAREWFLHPLEARQLNPTTPPIREVLPRRR